ncbi:hypothetical protein TA3x_003547 [Tundrisphaera sp. TA3]|uniref:hypothetical protein n=1 Tax=Tundrisphaera sp. TA3 TaxID=3435775 RepID=UPI003EC0C5E9
MPPPSEAAPGTMPGPAPGTAPDALPGGDPGAAAPDYGNPAEAPYAPPGASPFAFDGAGDAGAISGQGGIQRAAAAPKFMIGDQGPYFARQAIRFPSIPSPNPPVRPGGGNFGQRSVAGIVPAVRGFKIADNQSPRPVDRIFGTFNFYDNVNKRLNDRLNSPIERQQVYRQLYGFEKTFAEGQGSFGLRMPINTLVSDSRTARLNRTTTAAGNLGVFAKYVLYSDDSGNLISAGLSVDTPTGPAAFAGFPVTGRLKNPVEIQPYLGYIFQRGKAFVQGFGAVAVPTDAALPTMLFVDVALGYNLYQAEEEGSLISSFTPVVEAHLNTPFNHRGYSDKDIYGIPDVLNMTFGANIGILDRGILTLGYARPVTGPLPFDGEFILQGNIFFGRSRSQAARGGSIYNPILGN